MGPTIRQPITHRLRPVTFDAGALIAIERGDIEIRALARALADDETLILIPAPAIAEVWRGGGRRQAQLARFLNEGTDRGHIQIVNLTYEVAKELGVLLGRTGMSVTDAAVCSCALLARGAVVTSDPSDIERVIPRERIKVV